jgi:hypothetical protein
MPNIIATDSIMHALRDRLWAQLAVPLGLKLCQIGSLEDYPSGTDIDEDAPFILLRLSPTRAGRSEDIGKRREVHDVFRIVYGRKVATGNPLVTMMADVKTLTAELSDYTPQWIQSALPAGFEMRGAFVGSGGGIDTAIEWEDSPEDIIRFAKGATVKVAVVSYVVKYWRD